MRQVTALTIDQRSVVSILAFVAKLMIALGLLWLLLRSIDVHKVGGMLAKSDVTLFLTACMLLASGVAINALRWARVMENLDRPIGTGNAITGNFEAMFFNQILPTGVGGDAIRSLRAYDAGASTGFAIIGVLIDRAFGLWFVALSICVAPLWASSAMVASPSFQILAWVAALVVAGGIGTAVVGSLMKSDAFPRWAVPVTALVQAFAQVCRAPRSMADIGGALLLSNLVTIASFALCARALGVEAAWWDVTVILQGLVLASILPISVGGWGVREGAAILLFSNIGVGTNEAVSISILFGLVLTVVGLAGAVVWLLSGYQRFGGRAARALPRTVDQNLNLAERRAS